MVNPTFDYWTAAKRVLRYLKGTIDLFLVYEKGIKDLNVIDYSDRDFVGAVDDRKEHFGTSILSRWSTNHMQQLEAKGGGLIIV